jgi:hypothetical protein
MDVSKACSGRLLVILPISSNSRRQVKRGQTRRLADDSPPRPRLSKRRHTEDDFELSSRSEWDERIWRDDRRRLDVKRIQRSGQS